MQTKQTLAEQYPANLIYYPDERLAKSAAAIPSDFDPETLQYFISILSLKMKRYSGVGLAGPQIGIPYRIAVIDPGGKGEDVKVLLNPVVILGDDPVAPLEEMKEGCLSAPHFATKVTRPLSISLSHEDPATREWEHTTFHGFEARVVQHELDHLSGTCIVDYAHEAHRRHYCSLIRSNKLPRNT